MIFIIAGFVLAGGLVLGSFFNVLIWRLPRGESIVFPASHCTSCDRPIRPWENIPVLSFLFLRGKCAGCGAGISPFYPAVEIVTGLGALLLWSFLVPHQLLPWWHYGPLLIKMLVLLLMIPIAVIDIRHYIIPDAITLPGIVVALAISFIPGDTTPQFSFVGALTGGGILFFMGWLGSVVFKKGDAMGGGDVKLMAFAGALWGPQAVLLSIVFGALLGSVTGLGLMSFKRLGDDHRIPFGPFLGAGLWVAVLSGNQILTAYMQWVESLLAP